MKKTSPIFAENKPGRTWPSTRCFSFASVPIGRGALSTVYRATDIQTGKVYAIKKTELARLLPADQENVRRELEAYFSLSHPHIIRFYDYVIEHNVMYIILELGRGTLYHYMRTRIPMAETEIRRIFSQCVEVFAYIHSKGFLVRDIKPENILMDENRNIKVCDFGWSCKLEGCRNRKGKSGTYPYMSPESLKGQLQDTPSDVWSLGVLLYELHFFREPFPGRNEEEMLMLINLHRINFKAAGLPITAEAVDLIRSMLEISPAKRITLKEITLHAFFMPKSLSNTSSQNTGDTSGTSTERCRIASTFDFDEYSPVEKTQPKKQKLSMNQCRVESLCNGSAPKNLNPYHLPPMTVRQLDHTPPKNGRTLNISCEKPALKSGLLPVPAPFTPVNKPVSPATAFGTMGLRTNSTELNAPNRMKMYNPYNTLTKPPANFPFLHPSPTLNPIKTFLNF